MAWTVPGFSKGQVDRAGVIIANSAAPPADVQSALEILNNWRSAHSFPLNTMQMGLRRIGRNVDNEILVAQRIKRLSSIEHKLRRFTTMNMSQMQDIGGCRGVVRDIASVKQIVSDFRGSQIKHKLARVDDYIAKPQASGYRGVHLIYRYFSDHSETYNGLQIEIQVRSQLQHAWATAVETVGTFLRQALKSSQGHEEWLRFFALMGSALAYREKSPIVPGTPDNRPALTKELRRISKALGVVNRLQTYGAAMQTLEDGLGSRAHYFLLILDPAAGTTKVRGFTRAELEAASEEYLEVERSISSLSGAEAVLVSVDTIASLRRAYPNYFLDTKAFLAAVSVAIE